MSIIYNINSVKNFEHILSTNEGLVVIKFGADWCKPCQKIKPYVDDFFSSSPSNVTCYAIDIDDDDELFTHLKFKKMVYGIPVLLCYKKGNSLKLRVSVKVLKLILFLI